MDSNQPPRLEFRLEGDPRNEGLVLAHDFVAFLASALGVLRKLEEERGRKSGFGYRIVDLEIGSALVAIEPEVEQDPNAAEIVGAFLEGAAAIRDGTIDQKKFQPETRRAFLSLVRPLRENHLRSISIRSDSVDIELADESVAPLWLLSGPELHTVGELTGYIDAINVHREPVFFLYPEAGPARVRCLFDRTLLDQVRSSLKRFVSVQGLFEYPPGSPFPARVTVDRIEVLPDEDELPSLESLFGSVPDLAADMDSVAYVRRFRDAQG
jgi:hypothetical protein